ncbi:MAG: nucleotide kinase domain-containing protein [Candidatus Woesearchaeota archaeon]
MHRESLDLFWRFIAERQAIWHLRFILKQKWPWTEDAVLRDNRFTNIYRELDPGTQYALNDILETDFPAKYKTFNIMLYRLIGKKETHKSLGFQRLESFSSSALSSGLKRVRESGEKPFTAAYLVAGYAQYGGKDKCENVANLFKIIHDDFDSIWKKLSSAQSMQEAYKIILNVPGFGNFLSFQVLVDLTYPLNCLNDKPLLNLDQNEWAAAGPGAKRGILLLDENAKISDELRIMKWLQKNQKNEFSRLGIDFKYWTQNGKPIPISLPNIQNCLCEFHKYVKIKNNTGRARRKYHSN